MKRFLILNCILIISLSLVLWIGIKKMPDNGIFRQGNQEALKGCSSLFALTGLECSYSTAKEYEEEVIVRTKELYEADDYDILYVTSDHDNSYNILTSSFSFTVEKVIKGNEALTGKVINAETIPQSFFQELDDSSLEMMEGFFDQKGLNKDDYPWFYSNREVCYSFTSVPKEGEHYIIFIGEFNYIEEKEPLYLLLDNMFFPESDVSNDRLLKFEDAPIYSNYADNYTFFYRQQDLDWYIELKNDIYKTYLYT